MSKPNKIITVKVSLTEKQEEYVCGLCEQGEPLASRLAELLDTVIDEMIEQDGAPFEPVIQETKLNDDPSLFLARHVIESNKQILCMLERQNMPVESPLESLSKILNSPLVMQALKLSGLFREAENPETIKSLKGKILEFEASEEEIVEYCQQPALNPSQRQKLEALIKGVYNYRHKHNLDHIEHMSIAKNNLLKVLTSKAD